MNISITKLEIAQKKLLALFPAGTISLRAVQQRLEANGSLGETRRRDLISALVRVSKMLNLDLEHVPADPVWLRSRLRTIEPARLGVQRQTWANIISNALAALAATGVTRKSWRSTKLSPSWQALWDGLEDQHLKIGLGSFFRFCSQQGVLPECVSDRTVEEFRAALELAASLRKSLARSIYYLTTGWNKAGGLVQGWPQARLAVPKRRVLYARRREDLPSSFLEDLERYIVRMKCVDPLAEDAPPRPLAGATLKHRERQIRRFFGELVQCGFDPSCIPDLRAMVQPDTVRLGLKHMLDRRQGRSGMIYGMAYMLVTIGKHFVKLPPEDINALSRFARNLKPDKRGMTEKNRVRLRQFDDDRHLKRLLNLPQELLRDANSGCRSPKKSALLAETALAIELLILTVLRIKNLSHLHLDNNFSWTRAVQKGTCHLFVEAQHVKNGQPRCFELNKQTADMVQAFVSKHQRALVSHPCRWLFGRRDGSGPVDESVLGNRITRIVRKRTGLIVNPHLFRALGILIYLKKNPGAYEAARRLLGHKHLSTVIDAYTGLEDAAFARHFDKMIQEAREPSRPTRKRRGRA